MTRAQSLQRAHALENFIVANPQIFTYGNVMSWGTFQQHFGRFYPNIVGITPYGKIGSSKYVAAYTSLNRLLARHGYYIKSKNYYTQFKILDQKNTRQKVFDYNKRSAGHAKAAFNLLDGLSQNTGVVARQPAAVVDSLAGALCRNSFTTSYR